MTEVHVKEATLRTPKPVRTNCFSVSEVGVTEGMEVTQHRDAPVIMCGKEGENWGFVFIDRNDEPLIENNYMFAATSYIYESCGKNKRRRYRFPDTDEQCVHVKVSVSVDIKSSARPRPARIDHGSTEISWGFHAVRKGATIIGVVHEWNYEMIEGARLRIPFEAGKRMLVIQGGVPKLEAL